MIRARFYTSYADYRSVNWPVKHPYWCSGIRYNPPASIIVAYADDLEEILSNWPDATEIEFDHCERYIFTTRFPRPTWFVEPENQPVLDKKESNGE